MFGPWLSASSAVLNSAGLVCHCKDTSDLIMLSCRIPQQFIDRLQALDPVFVLLSKFLFESSRAKQLWILTAFIFM